ncbi:MAG: hypothetical protein NTW19_13570 [Planctomycetota bacterium]|nr:hypothetical protein [Planctomycetota bacterium]
MFLKSLTVIVFFAAVAVLVLSYRQQRLEMTNEMARLHHQIDQSRQKMWDLQVKIADHVEPPALAKAIDRAHLKLESATPNAGNPVEPTPPAKGGNPGARPHAPQNRPSSLTQARPHRADD